MYVYMSQVRAIISVFQGDVPKVWLKKFGENVVVI